nr:hypothetical protein [Tanacetum cinerariifolium]
MNYMQQLMPNTKDIADPTNEIDMALILMTMTFKLNNNTPINNNQTSPSNPCNRQIAQPGEALCSSESGTTNLNGNGNVVAARAEGIGACEEIKEVNANCTLMENLQQASTSSTQTDKAPIYDSDGSAENENNVILVDSNMEPSGGTIIQDPATIEETHALFESLYNNLVMEVEKVNMINLNIKHMVKVSEKARIMKHKRRVQESILTLTTYIAYQDFNELKDHSPTLKNAPYTHQRYAIYNILVNEEEPTGFISICQKMAYSSSSANADSNVHTCSTKYEQSYAQLKKLYDDQREKLDDASVEITAYTLALRKVEAQLVVHQKNQLCQLSANDKAGLGHDGAKESKVSETITSVSKVETSNSKTSNDKVEMPKIVTIRMSEPIIEEWESDSEDTEIGQT